MKPPSTLNISRLEYFKISDPLIFNHTFNAIFKKAYLYIAEQVWDIDASIHIVAHGYGYAVPDGRAVVNFPGDYRFIGPWLRPAFTKKNITDPVEAESIMKQLIDLFNATLQQLDTGYSNFHYVDLRDIIERADWLNELHLTSDAYRRVAKKLHQLITGLPRICPTCPSCGVFGCRIAARGENRSCGTPASKCHRNNIPNRRSATAKIRSTASRRWCV